MKVLQFSHFLMMVGDLPFNNLQTQRSGRWVLEELATIAIWTLAQFEAAWLG